MKSGLITAIFHMAFFTEYQDRAREIVKEGKSVPAEVLPSVLKPLFYTYKLSLFSGGFFKLVHDLLQFVAPELLRQLLGFMRDPEQPLWLGITIASMMFLVAIIQSMILHQYFHMMFRMGMNIRSVLTSAVYKKMNIQWFRPIFIV